MMTLSRAGRRALTFLAPYLVTISLIPRLGLLGALMIGLAAFAVAQALLRVVARRDHSLDGFTHRE